MATVMKFVSQALILAAIVFFFYEAYVGVVKDGGSSSVFTGVGALIVTLIGSALIEKYVHD